MTFSVLHCIFILMVLLNNIIFLEVMLYEGKPYMYVLVKCYHAEVHVFLYTAVHSILSKLHMIGTVNMHEISWICLVQLTCMNFF